MKTYSMSMYASKSALEKAKARDEYVASLKKYHKPKSVTPKSSKQETK